MPHRRDADVAIRCDDLSIARADTRRARAARDRRRVVRAPARADARASWARPGRASRVSRRCSPASTRPGLAVVGGDAVVEGVPIRRPGRSQRFLTYVTGHLPQSAGADLPARFTVAEVIGEPITSRDRHVNQRALAVRVATLLDELMLPLGAAAKYPYELSAGMRQRVAFARALVLQPRIFIADEPFANMDIEVRRAARDAILRRRRDYGMSALIVTNEVDVVARTRRRRARAARRPRRRLRTRHERPAVDPERRGRPAAHLVVTCKSTPPALVT